MTKYVIVAVSVPAVLEWLRLRLRRMTLNLAYFDYEITSYWQLKTFKKEKCVRDQSHDLPLLRLNLLSAELIFLFSRSSSICIGMVKIKIKAHDIESR